jgi:hypothetical protein
LLAVALAATRLVKRAFPNEPFDFPAHHIWLGRDVFHDFAKTHIGAALPDPQADPPDDLIALALKSIQAKAEDGRALTPAKPWSRCLPG